MQIKGNVLLSRIQFVRDNFGETKWSEILGTLSEKDRETVSNLYAVGWYPFELGKQLDATIVRVTAHGDTRVFEKIGAASAQKNLNGAHRHFLCPGNPQAFLEKASSIYKFYYDTGWREYKATGPTSGVMTTHESDTYSTADCMTVIGWHKEALVMCGAKDVSVVEDTCRARGGDVCRYQIHWAV